MSGCDCQGAVAKVTSRGLCVTDCLLRSDQPQEGLLVGVFVICQGLERNGAVRYRLCGRSDGLSNQVIKQALV